MYFTDQGCVVSSFSLNKTVVLVQFGHAIDKSAPRETYVVSPRYKSDYVRVLFAVKHLLSLFRLSHSLIFVKR